MNKSPIKNRAILFHSFNRVFGAIKKRLLRLDSENDKRGQLDEDQQKKQKFIQLAMDNIPQFIFWKNCDSIYMGCNENFAKIAGVASTDDIVGKSDYDLAWKKEEADFFRECDRRVMDNNSAEYHIIESQMHADGKAAWIDTNKIPLHDESGKVVGILGTFEDISARILAEKELRHLKSYLSNIIDSMPSMIVGLDLNGTVTQWNLQAEKATGLSQEMAVGKSLERTIPRLASDLNRIQGAIKTRKEQFDPRRSYLENGENRYENITIYPLIANGSEGAVIRVDDVTERVRMEDMMVQSEKMMSIGGLAAGMAHEINNPLSGMMQTAQVISNRLTGMDIPANKSAATDAGVTMETINAYIAARDIPKMLNSIGESGKRAADIVSNMLDFSRLNSGCMSTHDISQIMDKCVELSGIDYALKNKYDFRQIKIIREYEDNLPEIPCDAGKIQQVIMNILRNGAQEMQKGASKTENPCFTFRITHDKIEEMICIEIKDNGPGMEESIRKRVFEPFFTTKPAKSGTGLGLSVSYFIIIENHMGEMNVESMPGKGTSFFIRLPVKR